MSPLRSHRIARPASDRSGRGGELHLFEGFPHEWAAPGMVTRLNGVLTPFGPLHRELRVAADGKSARLMISKLKDHRPDKIVVHLSGLTGREQTVDLPTDHDIDQTLRPWMRPSGDKGEPPRPCRHVPSTSIMSVLEHR